MAFLTDSSSNNLTLTVNGTVTNNTTTFKYGGGSAFFNGSSSLQTTGLSLGTSDFTCECWLYPTVGSTFRSIFNQGNNDVTGSFIIYLDSSDLLNLYADNNPRFTSGTTVPVNQWSHIAVSRQGNTYYYFINGLAEGSHIGSFDHFNTPFKIGDGYGGIRYFTGYIDDVRVTTGIARYTTGFALPTQQFPDPTETTSLGELLQENSDRLLLEIN